MVKCTVMCDWCGGLVEGRISHYDGVTAGFYLRGWLPVANKGTQNDLFPDGKNIGCDHCVQNTDAYKALYGSRIGLVGGKAPARMAREDEVVRSYDDCLAYIKNGAW